MCDRLSALKQVGMDRTNMKARLNHVDLILVISELWETFKFKIIKEHVYGHYDNLKFPLTQLEQLNCRMDAEAKQIELVHINNISAPTVFHSTKLGFGTVICGNKLVTSRLQATLYKHITNN